MRLTAIVFLLMAPFFAISQTYELKGRIAGLTDGNIRIIDFYGNENRAIDSVAVADDGSFSYRFPDNARTGMYRLRWGRNLFMDVIFNHEDIRFSTYAGALADSLVFKQSPENELYFNYLRKRNDNELKLELLHPLLTHYPKDDPFYKKIETHYDQVNSELKEHVDKVIKNNPQTLAARLIKADFTPRPPATFNEQEQINYLKVHFFDNIDFTDTDLLFTSVLPNKLIQYLSLYQNNRLSKDQLEIEFIKAVSVMMEKTAVNPEIYEFAMDYLISGFNSYGFDRVITYIADNINLDDQCYDEERRADLEQKVESLRKFAIGRKAPDFTAKALNGASITLSEIESDYTLLVFWATWCPHCTGLVTELQQIYLPDNRSKLEIVAVSLDDSEQELLSFLDGGEFNWINISDYKRWQGELVQLFDVYATPTMLLVSNDLTIMAKPMNYNEVKNELFKLNVLK